MSLDTTSGGLLMGPAKGPKTGDTSENTPIIKLEREGRMEWTTATEIMCHGDCKSISVINS